jgi:predicted unusual protein kinase regulating ubiquinone biosynthesis (AarF/ABC1/UbiB family)
MGAGVAGWLAALALSLAIASGDTGAPGFTRNLWVFAAVFTMSASVWVELLAKPGALARAQRGLVSVPHPLRAVRRSSRRLSRYAQISGIAVKHGFGPLLGLGALAAPAARRLRLALEECGGMFVKLGQVLSTRADLLPAGVVAELARVAETRTAWGADYHVTDLAGEFADRLREELDFRLEARNAIEIAAAMAATDQVHLPAVHSELSTPRVLVMEWLDGVSVREVERIDALGLDRARLAEALLRCALRQMLVDGRFHADPTRATCWSWPTAGWG